MNTRYLYYSKKSIFIGNFYPKYSTPNPYPFCLFYRQQSSNVLSPLKKYDLKVSEGKLLNDEFQKKVVCKLEKVYENLQSYKPPKKSFMWKFIQKRKSVPNQPQGLYLYGAVGGGKTMLMDLFYSCCKVIT